MVGSKPHGMSSTIGKYPFVRKRLRIWEQGLVRNLGLAFGLLLLIQSAFLGIIHGATPCCLVNRVSQLIRALEESLLVFPGHGIQLETHRGFKGHIFSSTRTFIPFRILRDVVINEALYGWNVRYYIVAITQPKDRTTTLQVAFPVSPRPHLHLGP